MKKTKQSTADRMMDLAYEQFNEGFLRGYEQGQEDKYRELTKKYLILTDQEVKDIKSSAIMEFLREMCLFLAKDNMYTQAQIFEVAEIVLKGKK